MKRDNVKRDNDSFLELFKKIMGQCKRERRLKTGFSNKELALALKITENYVSALEGGRAVPSIKVFLSYLLFCGFDTEPLARLEIRDHKKSRPSVELRSSLIEKIYSFDEEQILYLLEQAKLAELFRMKLKTTKKRSGLLMNSDLS